MPWTKETFKKHWPDATDAQLEKASKIANGVLKDTGDEGKAISIGIAKAKVSAAYGSAGDEIIANAWGGEVEISAIGTAPVAPLDVPPGTRAAASANGQPAGTDGGSGVALDNPDAKGCKMEPGPIGDKIKSKDGKEPLPKFNLSAYNGGPMKLAGFTYPIVIDATGVKFAANPLPIYAGGHPSELASPSELMDCLAGMGACSIEGGRIKATGEITGDTPTIRAMLTHARNGVKFQNSVHGRPIPETFEFIRAGTSVIVNGQTVTGPASVARQSVLDHIAILPLGADTTTSAHIAASNAAGVKNMEFSAFLKAEYGMEQAAFDALPDPAKAKIKAAFDGAGKPKTEPEKKEPEIKASADTTGDTIKAQNEALAANLDRVTKIGELAKDFPAISAQAVREGWTVEKTENAVLKAERDKLTAGTFGASGAPSIGGGMVPKDGLLRASTPAYRGGRHDTGRGSRLTDDMSAIVEAAGLISARYSDERLVKDRSYGERTVLAAQHAMSRFGHGLGPVGLMRLAASFAGIELPSDARDPRFLDTIRAEFTTLNLPVILSNLMNKFLLDGYNAVDPDLAAAAGEQGVAAWQKFVKRTTLQDFKPHYRVRLVGDTRFKDLGPTGEIQHGKIGEQSYTVQAKTKAIMLGISREQIINDDLSAMSTLPTNIGRGFGITIAESVYAVLIAALQSDNSTAFFTTSTSTTAGATMNPNMQTAAADALGFASLESAVALFDNQIGPDGLPTGLYPEILLVPPGLKGLARQLYDPRFPLIQQISTSGTASRATMTPASNYLGGLYRPVCSSYLARLTNVDLIRILGSGPAGASLGSTTTWYLLAGPQQAACAIEAGFLNGQEMPIIERGEADFDRLGIGFRGFGDFGVSLAEPRAGVKSTIA